MNADLSRFKVIYNNRVYNAIALENMEFDRVREEKERQGLIYKPTMLEVIAINEDGNIIIIHDESWTFQFIPIVKDN